MAKLDDQEIIEHVNTEHVEELIWIIKAFTDVKEPSYAQIERISDTHLFLAAQVEGETLSLEIPFTAQGEFREKSLLMAMEAMIILGIEAPTSKKRYFNVLEKVYESPNMLSFRLEALGGFDKWPSLTSARFALQKVTRQVGSGNLSDDSPAKSSWVKKTTSRLMNKAMLRVMKASSSKVRQSLMSKLSGGESRTYTFRGIDEVKNQVWIDVFIHDVGKSPANQWALSLNEGDVIRTVSESSSKTPDMSNGNVLICADETGLPAVRYFLSEWDNETLPLIMLFVQDQAEADLIKREAPKGCEVVTLLYTNHQDPQQAIDWLNESGRKIDVAWGGLEMRAANVLKKHFKQNGMSRANCSIHPYWVNES